MRLIATSLFLASTAAAQVSAVGPFVGTHSEGFENSVSGTFHACMPNRVFNSTADLCTINGQSSMNATSGWSFRCSLQEYAGAKFCGSSGPVAVYTFDSDVQSFGGYLATNAWNPGQAATETVTIRFYDRPGGLIDSVLANVTDDCTWTWNGWTSTVGIARVELENSYSNGGFVMMDEMQVSGAITVGTVHCHSNANSTGVEAQLDGQGSASLATNMLTLAASDLPQNSFGFFITSRTAGMSPNPGGSDGILCLGGSIGRFLGPNGNLIQNSGASGEYSLAVDLTSLPQPTSNVAAVVGDTWYFQSWFRDANPTPVSNFTSGLQVVIEP